MTLTSAGLEVKRLETIIEDMNADARLAFGATTNTEPDSVLGQLIGVFAAQLAPVWELAQQLYDSFDPDQAEGAQLDNLCALTGVTRQEAQATQGFVRLTGLSGVAVPAGSIVENSATLDRFSTLIEATLAPVALSTGGVVFASADNSATRTAGSWLDDGVASGTTITFSNTASNNILREVDQVISATKVTLTASVTNETAISPITTIGRADVFVSAVEVGERQALAFDVDTIIDTQAGWKTVVNVLDLLTGREAEQDPELRIRREESLSVTGASVDFAIRSRLRALKGVKQALVISNRSDTPDSEGRPAHSFEAIVWPDLGDATYRASIARTIFENQPSGIQAFGLLNFEVVDAQDITQNVGYSFAQPIVLYVLAALVTNDDFPADGNALVQAALLSEGNALSVGDDVRIWKFSAALDAIPGIVDVDVAIDTSDPPSNTANIPVGWRQIALFDSTRIAVLP